MSGPGVRDERGYAVPSMQVEFVPGAAGVRRVRPSTPEDGPAIVALMRQAGLQPHVDPEHLHWKYWREHPDWSGSRSFVLTDGRDLLAHGAVVPGTMRWGTRQARVIHMIDWAARREAIGAGVLLMKHMGGMTDFLLGIGGSRQSREIMPRIGYQCCGTVRGYVRTLNPLAIPRRPTRVPWKRGPRMARSLLWILSAPQIDLGGWAVRRIGPDALDELSAVLPAPQPGLATVQRSTALLRHALACPIVPVELFALERGGRIGGYFMLSFAPGQARLIDGWVRSEDPADWRALAHAAVQTARRHGGTAELATWASDPRWGQILRTCGFHERVQLPIGLRPSAKEALPAETLRVQMIDNDEFYLYFGGNQLWA